MKYLAVFHWHNRDQHSGSDRNYKAYLFQADNPEEAQEIITSFIQHYQARFINEQLVLLKLYHITQGIKAITITLPDKGAKILRLPGNKWLGPPMNEINIDDESVDKLTD